MRAAAMAASHPACPAPTTTTSNCSVKCGMASFHSNKDLVPLELRSADIGERRFMPLGGGEIPIAGAGFMIISASAVRDSRRTPVIHAHLKQCAGRNSDPGPGGTAFELACGQRGPRRRAPEMPDPIGPLS